MSEKNSQKYFTYFLRQEKEKNETLPENYLLNGYTLIKMFHLVTIKKVSLYETNYGG